YRLGGIRMGVYVGELDGYVFAFTWRWFSEMMQGHGRVIIAGNRQKLAGHFWIGDNEETSSDLTLAWVGSEKPDWVNDSDFGRYQEWFDEA
ncbi:MAG TPA: hypothetical protein VJZ27_01525, partial [Aggregatilineales bacterium]|nr:hypothetical protein [Aggregatilineales bacterium]